MKLLLLLHLITLGLECFVASENEKNHIYKRKTSNNRRHTFYKSIASQREEKEKPNITKSNPRTSSMKSILMTDFLKYIGLSKNVFRNKTKMKTTQSRKRSKIQHHKKNIPEIPDGQYNLIIESELLQPNPFSSYRTNTSDTLYTTKRNKFLKTRQKDITNTSKGKRKRKVRKQKEKSPFIQEETILLLPDKNTEKLNYLNSTSINLSGWLGNAGKKNSMHAIKLHRINFSKLFKDMFQKQYDQKPTKKTLNKSKTHTNLSRHNIEDSLLLGNGSKEKPAANSGYALLEPQDNQNKNKEFENGLDDDVSEAKKKEESPEKNESKTYSKNKNFFISRLKLLNATMVAEKLNRKDFIPKPTVENIKKAAIFKKDFLPIIYGNLNPALTLRTINEFPAQYPEMLNLNPMSDLYSRSQPLDSNEKNILGSYFKNEKLEEDNIRKSDSDVALQSEALQDVPTGMPDDDFDTQRQDMEEIRAKRRTLLALLRSAIQKKKEEKLKQIQSKLLTLKRLEDSRQKAMLISTPANASSVTKVTSLVHKLSDNSNLLKEADIKSSLVTKVDADDSLVSTDDSKSNTKPTEEKVLATTSHLKKSSYRTSDQTKTFPDKINLLSEKVDDIILKINPVESSLLQTESTTSDIGNTDKKTLTTPLLSNYFDKPNELHVHYRDDPAIRKHTIKDKPTRSSRNIQTKSKVKKAQTMRSANYTFSVLHSSKLNRRKQQDIPGNARQMNEFHFNGHIKLDPNADISNVKIVHGTPPADFVAAFATQLPPTRITTPFKPFFELPPSRATLSYSFPTYKHSYPWAWYKERKYVTTKHNNAKHLHTTPRPATFRLATKTPNKEVDRKTTQKPLIPTNTQPPHIAAPPNASTPASNKISIKTQDVNRHKTTDSALDGEIILDDEQINFNFTTTTPIVTVTVDTDNSKVNGTLAKNKTELSDAKNKTLKEKNDKFPPAIANVTYEKNSKYMSQGQKTDILEKTEISDHEQKNSEIKQHILQAAKSHTRDYKTFDQKHLFGSNALMEKFSLTKSDKILQASKNNGVHTPNPKTADTISLYTPFSDTHGALRPVISAPNRHVLQPTVKLDTVDIMHFHKDFKHKKKLKDDAGEKRGLQFDIEPYMKHLKLKSEWKTAAEQASENDDGGSEKYMFYRTPLTERKVVDGLNEMEARLEKALKTDPSTKKGGIVFRPTQYVFRNLTNVKPLLLAETPLLHEVPTPSQKAFRQTPEITQQYSHEYFNLHNDREKIHPTILSFTGTRRKLKLVDDYEKVPLQLLSRQNKKPIPSYFLDDSRLMGSTVIEEELPSDTRQYQYDDGIIKEKAESNLKSLHHRKDVYEFMSTKDENNNQNTDTEWRSTKKEELNSTTTTNSTSKHEQHKASENASILGNPTTTSPKTTTSTTPTTTTTTVYPHKTTKSLPTVSHEKLLEKGNETRNPSKNNEIHPTEQMSSQTVFSFDLKTTMPPLFGKVLSNPSESQASAPATSTISLPTTTSPKTTTTKAKIKKPTTKIIHEITPRKPTLTGNHLVTYPRIRVDKPISLLNKGSPTHAFGRPTNLVYGFPNNPALSSFHNPILSGLYAQAQNLHQQQWQSNNMQLVFPNTVAGYQPSVSEASYKKNEATRSDHTTIEPQVHNSISSNSTPIEEELNLDDMYWTEIQIGDPVSMENNSPDEIENACKKDKATNLVTNILAFGDSLTRGYYNSGKNHHPYTMKLQYLLNKMNAKRCFIVENEGRDGDVAFGEMPRRMEDVLKNSKKHFEWVIILGGTNDIYNKKHAGHHTAKELAQNIISVHDIAHNYGSKTMVVTIPEVSCDSSDICQDMKHLREELNWHMRAYANTHKSSVALCDLADSLARHNIDHKLIGQFFEGGLHLKPRGYEMMARLVFDSMKTIVDR